MGLGTGATAAIIGGIGAAGSVASSAIGASGAKSAASEEAAANEQAIQEQQREFAITQQNEQPFLSAGQTSIGQLMSEIQGGQFGTPLAAPQYTGGTFSAPTLAQAEAQPGYEFALQQGDKGILSAAAASGGAISGGTAKSLENYNQNLGETNYGNVFNQSLATYNAGLSNYQAQLAGYGAQLQGNNQAFNQLVAPAQIGSGSAATLASTGQAAATNVGQLLSGIGQAQAAGTVGSTNAVTSGLTSGTNSISQALLLNSLLSNQSVPNGSIPASASIPNYGALGPLGTAGMASTSTPAIPDYSGELPG